MSFKKQFIQFVDSFKNIRTNILFVIFFDLLFYALIVFIPLTWTRFLTGHPMMNELMALEGGVESMTADQMIRIAPLLKSFVVQSLLSTILVVTVLFFVYTLTRCLIWNTIEKKKFSWNYFKKYLLLNLVWVPIFFIISMVVMLILSLFMLLAKSSGVSLLVYIASFVMLIGLLIFLSINFLVYYFFMKLKEIFISIGKAFTVLFNGIKGFIVPLVFMAAVLYVLLTPFGILAYRAPFAEKYSIMQALVVIVYLAWLRFYLVSLVKKEVLRN
jgi:hypothetical protein